MRNVVTMSFCASLEYKPAHPERTAKRTVGWDVQFRTWTNREAMLATVRMQGKSIPRSDHWRPLVPEYQHASA